MRRRNIIVAGAGTLVTALSGCLGGNDDPSNGDGDGGSSPSNSDGESSPGTSDGGSTDGGGEEGPDDDIGNYDPEAVTRQYYEAANTGDISTMDDLSHSDGIAIHTHDAWAEQLEESYDLTIDRTEVVFEDLQYFYQPSALVEIAYEQARKDNDTSRVTRDQVVLVVEDDELLVYDTKGQNQHFRPAPLAESCDIEGEYKIEDRLPLVSETFYPVSRDESFGIWEADYRGPNGNWLFLEFGLHDSEEESEEVEMGIGTTHSKGDLELTTEAGLLARKGNLTCVVTVDNADATDQVDALYQEVGCFTEDDIVEQS